MNPFHPLEQYLENLLGADFETYKKSLLPYFGFEKFPKKTTLLEIGDICKHCYFVNKGCLQIFCLDKEGNETSRSLVFEHRFLTQLDSFLNQTPSIEGFRTLEKCELLVLKRADFLEIKSKYPAFQKVYDHNLQLSYLDSVERMNIFLTGDALDRARWLTQKYPSILSRLSNKTVASFLDISPETLSRLKSKL